MIKSLFIFLGFFIPLMANAFTLNNTVGAAFENDEVKVNVNSASCDNIGLSTSELLDLAEEAVDQFWNRAPTSRLTLVKGAVVDKGTNFKTQLICDTADCSTVNDDLKVDSDILIACNQNAATTGNYNFASNGVMAVSLPNNTSGEFIVGALVLINDRSGTAFADKQRDEQRSILAHEIGHAIGLGHSGVSDSLMYAISIENRNRLGWDDLQGVTYLYPKEQPIGGCGQVSLVDGNGPSNRNKGLGLLLFAIIFLSFIQFVRKFTFKKEAL
ncbi:MAG: matrixin family metalloprotease [Bacteriovoracaceae bacterium]